MFLFYFVGKWCIKLVVLLYFVLLCEKQVVFFCLFSCVCVFFNFLIRFACCSLICEREI